MRRFLLYFNLTHAMYAFWSYVCIVGCLLYSLLLSAISIPSLRTLKHFIKLILRSFIVLLTKLLSFLISISLIIYVEMFCLRDWPKKKCNCFRVYVYMWGFPRCMHFFSFFQMPIIFGCLVLLSKIWYHYEWHCL